MSWVANRFVEDPISDVPPQTHPLSEPAAIYRPHDSLTYERHVHHTEKEYEMTRIEGRQFPCHCRGTKARDGSRPSVAVSLSIYATISLSHTEKGGKCVDNT